MELKEGDTIRVGSSTRVYRLHWVPMKRAYDIENPFISPSDLAMIEEKEEETEVLEEENVGKISQDESSLATETKHDEERDKLAVLGRAKEIYQEMNSLSTENGEIQSVDSVLEGIVSLFPDENSGSIKEMASAPLIPEEMDSSFHVEKEEIVCSTGNDHELTLKSVGGVILQTLSQLFYECKQSSDCNSAIEAALEEEKADVYMARIELEPNVEVKNPSSDYHSAIEAVLEVEKTDISKERVELESNVEMTSSSFSEADANSSCEILKVAEKQSMLREGRRQMDALEAVLEEEKADVSMARIELESHVVCNPSSDYHSAIEAVLEGKRTDISKENLESNFEVTSSSFLEADADSGCEILEVAEKQSMLRRDHRQMDALEAVLEEEKADVSMARIELESHVVCNPSSDYYSCIEAVLEVEKTDISKENLESNFEVTSSSFSEVDADSAYEILEVAEKQSMLRKDHRQMDALEAVLEEEKADVSMARIELESHVACNPSSDYHSAIEAMLEVKKTDISKENLESNVEVTSSSFSEVDADSAYEILEVAEKQSMLKKDHRQMDALECVNSMLPEVNPSETNNAQVNNENQIFEPLDALRPLYEEGDPENAPENQNLNILIRPQTLCADDTAITETLENKENQNYSMKEYGQSEFTGACSLITESVNSSLPLGEVLSEIADGKESQTPQSTFFAIENLENIGSPPIRSEKKSSSCNIWSRRGKPDTPLQLQTSKSGKKNRRVNIDADIEWENQEDVESKSITRALFSGLQPMDEEIFTPDKENHTPNSFLRKFRKKGQLEDIQSPKFRYSKITFSSSIGPDEDIIASSDKENQTPKILQQRKSARPSRRQMKVEENIVLKERRLERVPLQLLLANSPGKSLSDASVPDAAARSSNSINCTRENSINSVGDGRRRWTMIADTTSLLDKASRKSLQLLEGLKGTHLVIPRMVIRELDSLKRRGSLFRRTTEADLVLQWIEECMVKTKWWIHVQSSVEDGRATAPTPPVSPVSRFSEGSGGFLCGTRSSASFSAYGSLLDIISPTAEDHILDYALSYRKAHSDGQLVLLSNDVTLKIKAMAEGLICETPQEFRDSLVNPFSERFLWADSSPRGQTWSVRDDVVMKEKYYRSPSKKSSKGEGAKGLKLILLHNSHYGQFVKTM
ncbi:FHA domain-containing protein PS1 isoform X2 [Ricinus communis]|nr:FHA domain-containing protein PS1 isoform X2 [Ricinus communis]